MHPLTSFRDLSVSSDLRTILTALCVSSELLAALSLCHSCHAESTKALVLRLEFPDLPLDSTEIQWQSVATEVESTYLEYSYGQFQVEFDVSTQTYELPRNSKDYSTEGEIRTEALVLAGSDHDFNSYQWVVYTFPALDQFSSWAGKANVAGDAIWINGFRSHASGTRVLTHEAGHLLGLGHASWRDPLGVHDFAEYGDLHDVMGSGSSADGHFSLSLKEKLGWIPQGKLPTHSFGSGSYRLYPFDDGDSIDHSRLGLKLRVGRNSYFYLGVREKVDATAVYATSPQDWGATSEWVDLNPYSFPEFLADRADSLLEPAGVYTEEVLGVTIENVATGFESGVPWIDVAVNYYPRMEAMNHFVICEEKCGYARVVVDRRYNDVGNSKISYETRPISAEEGVDYQPGSGVLEWKNGESGPKTIMIPVVPDSLSEGEEVFEVVLHDAQNALCLDSRIEVRVIDPGLPLAGLTESRVYFAEVAPRSTSLGISVRDLAEKGDGSIVVVGDMFAWSDRADHYENTGNIVCIDADYSISRGMDFGTGFNGPVYDVEIGSDGKMVCVGDFTHFNGHECRHVAQLNPDGRLDLEFASNRSSGASWNAWGLGYAPQVECVAIETDGSLLIGGFFSHFDGFESMSLVRLRPDGVVDVDSPFSPIVPSSQLWPPVVKKVVTEPDGDVSFCGTFFMPAEGRAGHVGNAGFIRCNPDGSVDPEFFAFTSEDHPLSRFRDFGPRISDFSPDDDGGYVLVGDLEVLGRDDECCRILQSGEVDIAFSFAGFSGEAEACVSMPDGKVIVSGSAPDGRSTLVRYKPDGSVDPSFDVGSGPGGAFHTGQGNYYGGGEPLRNAGEVLYPVVSGTAEKDGGGRVRGLKSTAAGSSESLWVFGDFWSFDGRFSYPICRLSLGLEPYDTWARSVARMHGVSQSLLVDRGADPDQDGLMNLFEMAVGSDPLVYDGGGEGPGTVDSSIEESGDGARYLHVSLRKDGPTDGIWFIPQFSDDCVNWSPSLGSLPESGGYEIIENSANRFIARDLLPVSQRPSRFARIAVVELPIPNSEL